jgi:hypothetical protein
VLPDPNMRWDAQARAAHSAAPTATRRFPAARSGRGFREIARALGDVHGSEDEGDPENHPVCRRDGFPSAEVAEASGVRVIKDF